MYARKLDGQVLTFWVSGRLEKNSLVMADEETNSSWVHILGEAIDGPLSGKKLESLPSIITDWQTWKSKYPESSVAITPKAGLDFHRGMYQPPSAFLIGLTQNEQSRAWGFDRLQEHPVVNDTFLNKHLLVLFKSTSGAAILFDRKIDEKVLTFEEQDGKLIDLETNSVWNWIDGRCVEGSYKGKQLTPIAGIVSFTSAWRDFHPKSTTWEPDTRRAAE